MRNLHLVFVLLHVVLLAIPGRVGAQIDTEFWFVAPEVTSSHGDDPVLLRFAAFETEATVVVSMPADPVGFPPQTLVVPSNGAESLDLTPWLDLVENKPFDQVHGKGIHIVSSADVSAYYEVNPTCQCNPDIFALKGENALGMQFLTPFQTLLNNSYSNSPSGFDVVATEANTTVTITPTQDLVGGHPAGVPFEVWLPEPGSTYAARAVGTSAALHPAGSLVTSDAPIAVTIHDDSANGSPFGGCSDLMGDQLIPVDVLGTEYIVVKGYLNGGSDRVYVVAVEDETEVSVGGIPLIQIDAGQTFSYTLSDDAAYIETSSPAYIWHLTGFGCEVGGAVLPSLFCTGSPAVNFVRSTNEFIGINLLAPAGIEGDFTFNGASGVINASDFSIVPGTNGDWVFAQIPASDFVPQLQASRIANPSGYFHLGIVHGGSSSGTRYGYFSSFGALAYHAEATDLELCEGDEAVLSVAAIENGLYEWSGPNAFTAQGQEVVLPAVEVGDSGPYVVADYVGQCAIANDTVWLYVAPIPDAPLVTGPDLVCEGDEVQLVATPVADAWIWTAPDGDLIGPGLGTLDLVADPAVSGTFWAQAVTDGCPSEPTAFTMDVIGTESFALPPPATYEICSADAFVIQPEVDAEFLLEWTLPGGEVVALPGNEALELNWPAAEGSDFVVVEASYLGCAAGSDSVWVEVLPTPASPEVGEPDLPCEGDDVALTASGAAGSTIVWIFPNGVTQAENATLVLDEVGASDLGTYFAMAISNAGCPSEPTAVTLDMAPLPTQLVSDWTYELTVCPGVPVELGLSQYDPAYAVSWTFESADGAPVLALEATTSVMDAGEGIYTIDYQMPAPCSLSATGQITLNYDPCVIFIPNVISPNNADARNNAFRIPGLSAFPNSSIEVFNRWGQSVYTHPNFGDAAGWSPMADEASEGVYYWMLQIPSPGGYLVVETINGIEEYMEPGTVRLTGFFHLVR